MKIIARYQLSNYQFEYSVCCIQINNYNVIISIKSVYK